MAKQRMAGEKVAEEMSKADRHKLARERIAADPDRAAERLAMVDRDKYDVADFSDKDIIMAFQGGDFGDKDYARLTGKPMGGVEQVSEVDNLRRRASELWSFCS